ncbi:MAG: carboxypeptidase regulatory-like domain-containing protein, partial [Acidobacteria bacterium]
MLSCKFKLVNQQRRVASVLLLAALWLLSPAVLAQSTGTIAGTVHDSTGAVVPGADITLTNQATQAEFRTVSNDEGYFAFAAVLTGTYTVRAEMAGFKPWAFTGITMNPGDRRNLPEIKLEVGD